MIGLRDAIGAKRVSAREAVQASLAAVERSVSLNAFTQVFADQALKRAAEVDRRLAGHEHFGPEVAGGGGLAGVPIAIKDNICLSWGKTTCGSKILGEYHSPYTATAAQRLIDAGAIVVGKTNCDEFAMGSSGEHSAFGATRNPWDESRVPGGSSSGSAAAVACGAVPGALGSDTGGSIRQPAGWCSLVGLKPTYGRVSRYGLVAYASSLDQIGPMARTVGDAAALASVLCGHDAMDSTSLELPAGDFTRNLETPIANLVLGVPRQARSSANHPAVTAALESAIKVFTGLGAVVVDVDLPHTDYGIAAYYIIATAEASSNLARFDGIRYGRRAALGPSETLADLYARSRAEGFGHEVQRRIMLGTHVLSSGYYDAYYNTALKARRLIKQDYDDAFEGRVAGKAGAAPACHAILMPSSPAPAFKLGERSSDPVAMYLEDVYTVGLNLAGLPGVTVPAGFAEEGGKRLPVGVQLIGPALGEETILRIARMFEKVKPFEALV